MAHTNRNESNRIESSPVKYSKIHFNRVSKMSGQEVRGSGGQRVRGSGEKWKSHAILFHVCDGLCESEEGRKNYENHIRNQWCQKCEFYIHVTIIKRKVWKKKNTYNLWLKHFNWTKIVVFLFIHVFIYLAGSFRNIFLKFIVQFRTFFRLPINSLLSFILITFLSLFIIAWRVLHASWARFSNIRIRLDMLSVYIYFYKYI